jgi:hypothetical protein
MATAAEGRVWLASGKFDRRKGSDLATATDGDDWALSILLNRSPIR